VDVDVVPAREMLGDRAEAGLVGRGEVAQRLVGEDDAPPESVVGRVPLEHHDLMARIRLLHEEGEVEPRRPAADDGDLHQRSPDTGFGSPSANRDGRRGDVSSVVARPSVMISASR
jgi:hypothetical protein